MELRDHTGPSVQVERSYPMARPTSNDIFVIMERRFFHRPPLVAPSLVVPPPPPSLEPFVTPPFDVEPCDALELNCADAADAVRRAIRVAVSIKVFFIKILRYGLKAKSL